MEMERESEQHSQPLSVFQTEGKRKRVSVPLHVCVHNIKHSPYTTVTAYVHIIIIKHGFIQGSGTLHVTSNARLLMHALASIKLQTQQMIETHVYLQSQQECTRHVKLCHDHHGTEAGWKTSIET